MAHRIDRQRKVWVAPSVLGLLVAASAGAALAQRNNESPAIELPRLAPAAAPHDVVPDFAVTYRRAGSPKVVLLWNRTFNDVSQAAVQERKVTREVGLSSTNRSENSTSGGAGSVSNRDEDSKFDKTKTETTGRVVIAGPQRSIGLEERNATMLERAFVAEMNRAGVTFVDRALAIRATAAAKHRSGGDPQLIETDALQKFADLLMEVVWIEDKDAPAGYAFDVRTKDLRSGQELSSVYTRGQPPPPPPGEGAWVAGGNGYEYARPPAPPSPSPAAVGAAASHDVMRTLGNALASTNRAPRKP